MANPLALLKTGNKQCKSALTQGRDFANVEDEEHHEEIEKPPKEVNVNSRGLTTCSLSHDICFSYLK